MNHLLLLLLFVVSVNSSVLTKQENDHLQLTCGKDIDYTWLEPGRTFYASWWEFDQNRHMVQNWTRQAPEKMYFIGNCNHNARGQHPNGFILVEYPRNTFKHRTPACLPFHKHLKIGEYVQGQSYNGNGLGNRVFNLETISCGRQTDDRHCVHRGFLSKYDRGSPLVKEVAGQSTVFGILGDVAYNSNPSADEYFDISKHIDIVCLLSGICDPARRGKK